MAFKKTGNDGNGKKSYGKSYGAKSGGRSFEKKSFGGDRGGSKFGGARGNTGGGLTLFDVTCAQCGTATQVPFKPTGERPVLCRSCFNGGDGSASSAPRKSYGNAGSGDAAVAAELRLINEKLDKIIEALDLE